MKYPDEQTEEQINKKMDGLDLFNPHDRKEIIRLMKRLPIVRKYKKNTGQWVSVEPKKKSKGKGWHERADRTGKAPVHRAVARTTALKDTLRIPMTATAQGTNTELLSDLKRIRKKSGLALFGSILDGKPISKAKDIDMVVEEYEEILSDLKALSKKWNKVLDVFLPPLVENGWTSKILIHPDGKHKDDYTFCGKDFFYFVKDVNDIKHLEEKDDYW